MSVVKEEEIKRWTARRKSALVLEIIQGKTTVSEASRQFDIPPSEIESWVEDGKRGSAPTGASPARAGPAAPAAARSRVGRAPLPQMGEDQKSPAEAGLFLAAMTRSIRTCTAPKRRTCRHGRRTDRPGANRGR